MQPKHRNPAVGLWQFPADLHLIDWLNALNHQYDVVTDDDLDREGVDLLRAYNVVVTGSHPEYYSSSMLDAPESYVQDGGRLMYMGGNGFYWVTAYPGQATPHRDPQRRQRVTRLASSARRVLP